MAGAGTYDEIADWYENEFLARQAVGDPLGVRHALATLPGTGRGTCLEIGCGTRAHAAQIRDLCWSPTGIDLSAGMVRHAKRRLPAARADAGRLPVPDGAPDAVIAVMAHTDMPDYPAVLHEVARVLRPASRRESDRSRRPTEPGIQEQADAEFVATG